MARLVEGMFCVSLAKPTVERRLVIVLDDPEICSGCGLIRGIGWPDNSGLVVDPRDRSLKTDYAMMTDPSPDDPGYSIDDLWFCSGECGEFYLDEVMGGA